MNTELESRLNLALDAAREAGQITLEHFRRVDLDVQRKDDASPVTIADREAEKHLRRRIGEAFPDDAILGEEFPDQPGNSGFRWILDPIDGTKSFISGVPLYGTLIGVEQGPRSVIGVIRIPALEECVYAAVGGGAWYQQGDEPPQPARVSNTASLAEGLLCTSEVRSFFEIERGDTFLRLQQAAWITRTWGDCYGYLLVATGRAAVMIDPQMHVWDAAALLPVLQEAGGTFTDWQGVATIHSGNGVATNGHVNEEVLSLLKAR